MVLHKNNTKLQTLLFSLNYFFIIETNVRGIYIKKHLTILFPLNKRCKYAQNKLLEINIY